jgi:hypothetical protein
MEHHPYRVVSQLEPTAERFAEVFAPNIVFRSPIATEAVHGVDFVRTIQENAHQVLGKPHYRFESRDATHTFLMFDAYVNGQLLQAAVVIQDDNDGKVEELTVIMRPLPAVKTFGAIMASRLGIDLDI